MYGKLPSIQTKLPKYLFRVTSCSALEFVLNFESRLWRLRSVSVRNLEIYFYDILFWHLWHLFHFDKVVWGGFHWELFTITAGLTVSFTLCTIYSSASHVLIVWKLLDQFTVPAAVVGEGAPGRATPARAAPPPPRPSPAPHQQVQHRQASDTCTQ